MNRRLRSSLIVAGVLVAAAGVARASEPPPGLRAELESMVKTGAPNGVTAIVLRGGKTLYRLDVGPIAPDAQLPIASASKWMTAALIMTVVDEGKLSLDEPIGRRLPEFTGESGQITLRQLMSFTAGQGGLEPKMSDLRQDPHITLAESAKLVAAAPLQDPAGKVFRYGGPSLQVAGALVEQVTGKPWAKLFEERIAVPLGMSRTYWGNPLAPNLRPEEVRNPNLQAGVYTTAEDYSKFLTMIAEGGVFRGKKILSSKAIDAMETLQTRGVTMAYLPPGAGKLNAYALANWCEIADANRRCSLVSSPGAFGTYPWIDRDKGLYGVFFVRSRLPLVVDAEQAARDMILAHEVKGQTP